MLDESEIDYLIQHDPHGVANSFGAFKADRSSPTGWTRKSRAEMAADVARHSKTITTTAKAPELMAVPAWRFAL